MTAADPSQLTGTVLAGKYRVDRVLGKGGMGYVVAATHTQLDEPVAMKFLHPEMANDADLVRRFLREAKAAIKIRSEHVVRVLDVGTLDTGAPYMVMEFLAGDDLSGVIEKHGRLPVTTAVDYVLQACEALAEAHVLKMVHRDLKPANLFLAKRADGSPLVKVLDFGISKLAGPVGAAGEELGLTKTDAIMGSPLYMSPEQMRSLRDVDARSDIWALGVIIHELVSGSPAFNAATLPELCVAILQGSAPHLDRVVQGVPPGLSDAVQRCLEKEPANRFRNVGDLAAALAPYASPAGQASATRVRGVFTAAGVGQDTQVMPSSRESQPSHPSLGIAEHRAGSNPGPTSSPYVGPMSAPQGIGMVTTGGGSASAAWGQTQKPKGNSSLALALGVGAFVVAGIVAASAFVALPRLRGKEPAAPLTLSASATGDPAPSAAAPPASTAMPLPASAAASTEPTGGPAPESSAPVATHASAQIGARTTPPSSTKPSATPAATAHTATPAHPATPNGGGAGPAPAPTAGRAASCNPPFEFDANGNKRWKRECLSPQ